MKIYVTVLILSAIFLIVGNRVAGQNAFIAVPDEYAPVIRPAVVVDIIEIEEVHHQLGVDFAITNTFVTFIARSDGREVIAEQTLTTYVMLVEKIVEVGDRILLGFDEFSGQYFFVNYRRINNVIILAAIFLVLVVLLGRRTGINAIVSLAYTCGAVFFVLVPAILGGRNIYATTFIVCLYVVVSTLLIVIGFTKKAAAAILGCLGGVLLAGLLMLVMDVTLNLTGFIDQETQFLLMLPTERPINLRAVIFAGVVIGAVGAIMDVAMSIASALWELKASGVASFSQLFKAGVNIGKDTLGTMLNTLILAYIGSSLSLLLLITAHTTSYYELFNMEMVIVEFLRAIIGSFGMLLAIPLTSAVCSYLYSQEEENFDE